MTFISRLFSTEHRFTPKELQVKLQALGYYTGKIDGEIGPKSKRAIIAFKVSAGLKPTAEIGPVTIQRLGDARVLPWLSEITKVYGLHEVRDNGVLSDWLRKDGRTLGNPARLPWCGDAVETAIRLGLPGEPFPKTLLGNPYWARNWAQFGTPCDEVYGAVASFVRGNGGHVAFVIGVSANGTLYRVRGGNQSNMINDTWISKSRLLALRWPQTAPSRLMQPLPRLSSEGATISANEA
ncbi:peptidoglycan-binding protein [Phaeobacter gallaeciensis]|uniref:NlpC/P60 family protein n=1 Tax=Phaeobacter gallaeciensis TaxID=60890 RepID=UPI0023802ADD|nr:peptidoglycan-binding protein [Phaeobacter gallaeciensis]MDE4297075.1 peptidoglycan-binding protein [Phaeobacter gallaeciensis]